MDRKLLLILNPTSGRGAAAGSLFSIVNGFSKTGWEVTVIPTQEKGDAQKIARERAADFPFLVCCGGDGTLNETVNGLMEVQDRPLLGYIPAGTTNDFAATLGIPHNPEQAALEIGGGQPFCCDVGDLNGRYFDYIAAFGIFTDVSYTTPQQFKNVCGRVAYFLEGIKQLSSIPHYRLRVEWEGGFQEEDFIFGAVTNALSVGGAQPRFVDGIALNDGLFEVLLIRNPRNFFELQTIVTLLLKQELNPKYFTFIRTSSLRFSSESEIPWTLDGEYGGSFRSACIRNHPRAICIAVPRPSGESAS